MANYDSSSLRAAAPAGKPAMGPYRSTDFPLLGAATAICCSDAERKLFWESKPYDPTQPASFCKDRYGLPQDLEALLLAPEAQKTRPCFPDDPQIKAVVEALSKELDGKKPAPLPILPPALDPGLAAKYPTTVALFRYYLLGQGTPPSQWKQPLIAELIANRDEKDNVW